MVHDRRTTGSLTTPIGQKMPEERPVVGVDEAGRGCLAGPVVAGAVLFPPDADIPTLCPGLADSKILSEARRNFLAREVRRTAIAWSVGVSWPLEIDAINILNATFRAMSRAVSRLRSPHPLSTCLLAIDGNQRIRPEAWLAVCSLPFPEQQTFVRGDALVPSISAASILAKTFRDNLMVHLDRRYPGYGFAEHKGYGTQAHREAIQRLAPCPIHRKTFAGVKPEPLQLSLLG